MIAFSIEILTILKSRLIRIRLTDIHLFITAIENFKKTYENIVLKFTTTSKQLLEIWSNVCVEIPIDTIKYVCTIQHVNLVSQTIIEIQIIVKWGNKMTRRKTKCFGTHIISKYCITFSFWFAESYLRILQSLQNILYIFMTSFK